MQEDVKFMLKKVLKYDFIVGIALITLVYFINKIYCFAFLAGLVVASFNFRITGIIMNYILNSISSKHTFFNSILYIFKTFIVIFIGLLLFKQNRYFIIVYMAGFCSHFLALILYGINNKNERM